MTIPPSCAAGLLETRRDLGGVNDVNRRRQFTYSLRSSVGGSRLAGVCSLCSPTVWTRGTRDCFEEVGQ